MDTNNAEKHNQSTKPNPPIRTTVAFLHKNGYAPPAEKKRGLCAVRVKLICATNRRRGQYHLRYYKWPTAMIDGLGKY